MARNSSGTHSLPAGNPVVSGTTVAASVQNNTLSDISAEITDSLSRSGKGAMTAALELANGSVGTPALSFDSDTDTGLYRIGANNLGLAAGGVKVVDLNATTVALPVAVTSAKGITATQSTSNTAAITATGNGSGPGINSTGGSTGHGGTFTGGAAGAGVVATGTTNNYGVNGAGHGTAAGVIGTGGATASGLIGIAGGSVTADTNSRWAVDAFTGHIHLGGGNPASTTAFTNAVTPTSAPKVWASIDFNVSTATVSAGFNVTSAAIQSSTVVRITFASAFANTSYAWTALVETGSGDFAKPCIAYLSAKNASYVELKFYDLAGSAVTSINTTGAFQLQFFAYGAQ